MLRFFALFSFMLLASTAQAMESNPSTTDTPNDSSNDFLIAYLRELMAKQAAPDPQAEAYDPYAGFSPFEKEVKKIVYSHKKSEEKKEEIISLITRDDLGASYEEKVNSVLQHFPSFTSSDSSFSETQCIEIANVFAQQDPSMFFHMCVYPHSMSGPSALEFMDQNIKRAIIDGISNNYFEVLFNSQSNMEKRLEVLSNMLRSGGGKILTRVFNKYLDLKKEFNAPYLPASFRFVQTDQDLIAEFYALSLAPILPEILMDETINLDLKGRLAFANRCRSDSIEGIIGRGGSPNYKTPQSLIDFYKFVATCKDTPLTVNERFNAFEQLFVLSEGKEKQVLLEALQNEENPFALRHKLAHFGKCSSDSEFQEMGTAFIGSHQEEIIIEAKDRYQQLSAHSRMGIPRLRQEGALGKGVTVAICDGGFFKILPHDIYKSDLMKKFGSDEKSYQWKILHEGQTLVPSVFDEGWLMEVKNPLLPYHGSEMSDNVVTIAPEARVLPVAVNTNSSKSIIDAFNYLAEDPNVNIISCSFMLPAESSDLESKVKKSLLNCLKRNKIVVLATGNIGAYIPDGLSEPEPFGVNISDGIGFLDMIDQHGMREGLRVVSDLFKGEEEISALFSNFILVGSSKVGSLELHEKSVKPGKGPAQKRFVYADADELKNFFDDAPCWGGTSAAAAMVSGILADLWSKVKKPDENTAARVSRALVENTDIAEAIPVKIRGRGKVNAEKALEKLDKY